MNLGLDLPGQTSCAQNIGASCAIVLLPPVTQNVRSYGLQLNISDRTVQGHLAHIFAKLQATSRTEAVMRAVSLGWISQSTGQIAEE